MFFQYIILFFGKIIDNVCDAAKIIFIQKNRWIFAGISVGVSTFVYLSITKSVVQADSVFAILAVAFASAIGCSVSCLVSNKISKDRTYVNVIMSNDLEAMKNLGDFLTQHHITHVAADSYDKDWENKTITITAYPETKSESKIIEDYVKNSPVKLKFLVQPGMN